MSNKCLQAPQGRKESLGNVRGFFRHRGLETAAFVFIRAHRLDHGLGVGVDVPQLEQYPHTTPGPLSRPTTASYS